MTITGLYGLTSNNKLATTRANPNETAIPAAAPVNRHEAIAQDQAIDICSLRTKRQPQTNLALPLDDGVGHHAIDA